MLYEVITGGLEAAVDPLPDHADRVVHAALCHVLGLFVEGAEQLLFRITSYNVCYTKLLRGGREDQLQGEEHEAQRQARRAGHSHEREELGERVAIRRHAAQRGSDLDDRVADVVVKGCVGTFDVQTPPRGRDRDPP